MHELPRDLRQALASNTVALEAWKDITPLARNEFICWVEDAKREATRERSQPSPQREVTVPYDHQLPDAPGLLPSTSPPVRYRSER